MYIINGIEYQLKQRYSLKDWGVILKLLAGSNQSPDQVLISLLAEDKLKELLNLILDKPIVGELYEEDIETVARVINDFFGRSKSLIRNMPSSLTNLTENTTVQ